MEARGRGHASGLVSRRQGNGGRTATCPDGGRIGRRQARRTRSARRAGQVSKRSAKRRGQPPKAGQLVHVRLPTDLYRALKLQARSEDRTITAVVERVLRAALEKGTV